jgi:beta-N-acetylhexosaminidase
LKTWIADHMLTPDLSLVGCAEHQKVADEIARRSITLVRDQANLVPLQLRADQKIVVVAPKPQDLTPADTSSYIVPALAGSMRAYHPNLDEVNIGYAPSAAEIADVLQKIAEYDLVILGTINAYNQPGQQAIVREALKTNRPIIVVALRLPYDLAAFPEAPTYLCTFSILEPSMRALASALFGRSDHRRLPVTIPGV